MDELDAIKREIMNERGSDKLGFPNSKPYYENKPQIRENNKKIEKLQEKLRRLEEKDKIEKWEEEANKNPTLKDNNKKVVNRRSFTFFKVMTILFFLLLLCALVGGVYLVYTDKLDGLVQSTFNATINSPVDIDNQYDFKPETNIDNDYTFKPNYTIEIYNDINCPTS